MANKFVIDPTILAAARGEATKWGVSRQDADQEAAVAALRAKGNLRRACGLARAAVRRSALGGHGDALVRAGTRPDALEGAWDAIAIPAEQQVEADAERQSIVDRHAIELARQGVEGRILSAALRGETIDAIARRVKRTERRVRQVLTGALASTRAPAGQQELFGCGGAA